MRAACATCASARACRSLAASACAPHEFHELLRARSRGHPDRRRAVQRARAGAAGFGRGGEAYEQNVAVHNCYSPLATLMGAAFCASVPNLQMLEMDVDGVPWQNDFLTLPARGT